MTKYLPIFGLLFCLTVSSCALYQELIREQDSSATTKATQNSSNHRSPNQAHKQTTPRHSVAASAQTKPSQTPSNPQTTAANTPVSTPQTTNATPPNEPKEAVPIPNPMHIPETSNVICFSTITPSTPDSYIQRVNTESNDYFLFFDDNNLPVDIQNGGPGMDHCEANGGLNIYFRNSHDSAYTVYVHKVPGSIIDPFMRCTHSYRIVSHNYDYNSGILMYSIEMTRTCSHAQCEDECIYNSPDNHIIRWSDNNIEANDTDLVVIDTHAGAIIAELTLHHDVGFGSIEDCEFTNLASDWLYTCKPSFGEKTIHRLSEGTLFQSHFQFNCPKTLQYQQCRVLHTTGLKARMDR